MDYSRTRYLGIAAVAVFGLAACEGNVGLSNNRDINRATVGAGIGAAGAALTGGNAVEGAVIGGAAGALCDDVVPALCPR